ncbi:MAG: AI-2E family transporter [Ruminococcaceae bacterium]|nr:AI-2E family transporter [Oscillospiraceae bacterium]
MKKDDFNENKNHEEEKIPLNKKTLKFVLTIITFTLLLSWVLNHTSSFTGILGNILSLLSPFLIGACLAFVINTILKPLEKLWEKVPKKKRTKYFDKAKRPVCLAFSTIIVFGAVFAILFMIIPQLVETISSFASMLPEYIKNLEGLLDKAMKALERYNFVLPSIELDWSKAGELLNKFLDNYADSFINKTVDITTSIVTVIVNFVIAIFFSLYVLSQKEKIGRHFKRFLYAMRPKRKAEKIIAFIDLTSETFSKFVTGQLLEAVIIGVLCFIGMLILQIPYPAMISVLIGFTALIPVFGALFGTIVGALLILLVAPMKAVWFVIFIIVLQQIETNLIYPKVVGKTVGLPGILVLVSVSIGGSAFGIAGMLFSVPVCTVLYCVYKEFIAKKLKGKDVPEDLKD